MKKIVILMLIVVSCVNAQQKYFEFVFNDKYGVVDSEGNEVVAPIYDWKSNIVDYDSRYILLHDKQKSVAVNKDSGEKELFNNKGTSYLIRLKGGEYIFASKGMKSFLMNNKDFSIRISLPKKYKKVTLQGDYLIGHKSKGLIDFISSDGKKIVRGSVSLDRKELNPVKSYKVKGGYFVYSVRQNGGFIFLDKDLKQIARTNKPIRNFNEASGFLKDRCKIDIEKKPRPGTRSSVSYSNYKFPCIYGGTYKDGVYNVDIKVSKTEKKPFFKFNKLSADRLTFNKLYNTVELNRDGKQVFLFYSDVKKEKVLFPKKYWDKIGLKK